MEFKDQGQATAFWKFTPEGDRTKVLWGFDSDMGLNPIGKIFGLLMDRMLGPDYERGLSNLKKHCEEGGTESDVSAETSAKSVDDTGTANEDDSAAADGVAEKAGE